MNLGFPRALILGGLGTLLVSVGCGTSPSGEDRRIQAGGTGVNVTGKGGSSSVGNGNGGSTGISVTGGGVTGDPNSAPPDPDPTNPLVTHPKCGNGGCVNFPEAPILGEGVPNNAPMLFGEPSNMGSGLCVIEPQLSSGSTAGTMIPANWVRPRFRFEATGVDLFEVRIHNAAQKYDLVAYTKKKTWYLPKEIWAGAATANSPAGDGAANNANGQPFTVTIRGINSSSPGKPIGFSGDFLVAPVVATGSMVFWTVNSAVVTPTSSKLLGFAVGDEGVAESLTQAQVRWTGQMAENGSVLRGFYDKPKLAGFKDGEVRCIGCHTSTPDGASVVFTDDWPWSKAAANITTGNIGVIPTVITAGAQAIMKMPWWGTQTMSKAHWAAGDRILVTSYGTKTNYGATRDKPWFSPDYAAHSDVKLSQHQLAWINLESTATINVAVTATEDFGQPLNDREAAATAARGSSWDLIATGDTDSAVSPSLSHDGNKIAYVTTDFAPDGHPDYTAKKADIRVVDYNNRKGGTSQGLKGASEANYLEYYPSYSADDKFIAFTQAPTPGGSSSDGPYYNRNGKIMVIPAAGGTPTPLVANDPNACAGDTSSDGIINSWPKWSPDAVVTKAGKTYYFVIFSSARKYSDEFSAQFELPTSTASAFKGLTKSSQLYLAAVVVEGDKVTTYPAQYIWNQNRVASASGGDGMASKNSNLTPAWDPFQLPPITITQVPSDIVR